MGGDALKVNYSPIVHIVSIHAPVWGATIEKNEIFARVTVSIHAPVWGATRRRSPGPPVASGFNPRPRMGGDGWSVSVSASVPGFNPRPRMGGDAAAVADFKNN